VSSVRRIALWSLTFVWALLAMGASQGTQIEPLWSLELNSPGVVGEMVPLVISREGRRLIVAAASSGRDADGDHRTTVWDVDTGGRLRGASDIGEVLKPFSGALRLALPRADGGLSLLIEPRGPTLVLVVLDEKRGVVHSKVTAIPAIGVTFSSVLTALPKGYVVFGQRKRVPFVLSLDEDGGERWSHEVEAAPAGRSCGAVLTGDRGVVVAWALSTGDQPTSGKPSVLLQRFSSAGEVTAERSIEGAECGGFGGGRDFWLLLRDRTERWRILTLDDRLSTRQAAEVARDLNPVFFLQSVDVGSDGFVALDLKGLSTRISWFDLTGGLRGEVTRDDSLGPLGAELLGGGDSSVYVLLRSMPRKDASGTIVAGLRLIKLAPVRGRAS
jgi:hypothetical protein